MKDILKKFLYFHSELACWRDSSSGTAFCSCKNEKKGDNERCNAFYVFLYVEKDMHARKAQSRSTSGLNSSLVDPPEGVDQTRAQNTDLGSGEPLFG
jgi:hypothetical protein